LTYTCLYECDHCFLYCGPRTEGTFTLAQIRAVLDEAVRIGTVESVFFEGGEPFLYFPLLVAGLREARARGFKTGIVTNCFWATAAADAELWLAPIAAAGIDELALSDDAFHHGEGDDVENPAALARLAAERLGLPADAICIEKPAVSPPANGKGEPVVGGGALFKGRAVETLTAGLPTRGPAAFTACTHEELVAPQRVHVDAFGHVQVCQGVSIGNMWTTPLSELVAAYDAGAHPICGPLVRGGPQALAETHGIELDGGFVDECHYCFLVRRALLDRFPELLAPRQVYGESRGA
jgi:hypothetical protein